MAKGMKPATLVDKIWNAHIVLERDGGRTLLAIDRHFVHEGSHHGFAQVRSRGVNLARPDLTFGFADHYAPTRPESARGAPGAAEMIERFSRNVAEYGVDSFGLGDTRRGIVHVAAPELGLTLPGLTIVCGDSHTSTHGAFGAYAFGIGASEVAHTLITQTLWQMRPKRMRVVIDGELFPGVGAKDMALSIIAKIGADGAQGHAIEYAGEAVRGLAMAGRMTLCNLSIEAGARLGLIAPDETTFAYLKGRPFAPQGDDFDAAAAQWRGLAGDPDAEFDCEARLEAHEIAPIVTWGVTPDQAVPITCVVPTPEGAKAEAMRDALAYMDLRPGQKLTEVAIDRVFIGSCTNGRIEDLRVAAAVLAGRKAVKPGLVSPGSMAVKRQAEEEGLDVIFRSAGLDWVDAGCSMCVGMNGDLVPAGERCASTTNRNFKGRQGLGSRTHLMSPAMVAAAAITGHLADPRPLLEGRL
jgi:3-isopropylmalate/(R)-2-methylmalate dehydratase large subunit